MFDNNNYGRLVIDLNDNQTYLLVSIGESLFGGIWFYWVENEDGDVGPFTDDYINNHCLLLNYELEEE